MSALRAQVTQKFPALVQLADQVESALDTVKHAAQQLSRGGVSSDLAVIAKLPALPILDILSSLEALQQELADDWNTAVDDGSGRIEPLGMRDRQVVAQGLDLVVLFEVLPRLAPGIGVPLGKRLSSEVASVFSSLMRLPSGRRNWQPDETATLGDIVQRLTNIVDSRVGAGDVAATISSKYHADMVASLLQLAYAPRPPVPSSPMMLEGRYYVECNDERRVALQRAFTRMFTRTNPYLMLETLTSLLNEAGKSKGPRWMAVICSRFLARVLMKYPRDGARICLDFLVGHDSDLATPKLDRIARLLLSPPSGEDADDYFRAVVPQFATIAAIATPNSSNANDPDVVSRIMDAPAAQERMSQAAAYALRVLAQKNRTVFRQLVAEPALCPLRRWYSSRMRPTGHGSDDDPVARGLLGAAGQRRQPAIAVVGETIRNPGAEHPTIVASATELLRLAHTLQQLVPGGVPPAELVAELVCPVLASLVHWYAFENNGPTDPPASNTMAGMLREVLATALCALPPGAASAAVLEAVQLSRDSDDNAIEWPVFARCAEGTRMEWRSFATTSDQRLAPVDALIGLLGSAELRTVAGDVFLALLREQDVLLAEIPRGDPELTRKWWLVSQAALAAVDRLGPAVLTRHADILAFVLGVLDRYNPTDDGRQSAMGGGNSADGEEPGGSGNEVSLALMLLAQIMAASENAGFSASCEQHGGNESAADLPRTEWNGESLQVLRSVQNRVQRLSSIGGPEISQLCSQVALPISMVLALHSTPIAATDGAAVADDSKRVVSALRDVRDDLVPVRAHGIIELRDMVLARSKAITDNDDNLAATIAVFVEMVGESDSFVYLNAIRGLASLADLHLRRFLPQLVEMYTGATDVDRRVRVGEAILQSVQ
ncbi:hypothetical protein LPJ61_004714, partial [Coemansia biformis]